MNPNEQAVIAQHIRKHLDLAYDVAATLPKVREELIREGIRALKRILVSSFEAGELEVVETFSEAPFAKYAYLSARHRKWPVGVTVSMEAGSSLARDVFMGLHVEPPTTVPPTVIETLDRHVRSGRASNDWVWWYSLENGFQHWDERAAVLAFGNGDAPERLASFILDVVNVVHPLLSGEEPSEDRQP